MSVPVTADSRYTMVVATGDKTGTYQITTAFQPTDGDTCRARKTFSDSDTDNAAIAADSCFVTIQGSGDQAYYNYYTLAVPAAGLVEVNASSGDFTPKLYLVDAAGNFLGGDTGAGGYSQNQTIQSNLRLQLASGS